MGISVLAPGRIVSFRRLRTCRWRKLGLQCAPGREIPCHRIRGHNPARVPPVVWVRHRLWVNPPASVPLISNQKREHFCNTASKSA
jgi:hypothetical protein